MTAETLSIGNDVTEIPLSKLLTMVNNDPQFTGIMRFTLQGIATMIDNTEQVVSWRITIERLDELPGKEVKR